MIGTSHLQHPVYQLFPIVTYCRLVNGDVHKMVIWEHFIALICFHGNFNGFQNIIMKVKIKADKHKTKETY